MVRSSVVMLTVAVEEGDAAIAASHFANEPERIEVVTFQRRALLRCMKSVRIVESRAV